MRETSARAYNQIKREGLLSRMRWTVYRTVYHHGPLTGHELDSYLAQPDETKTSYHKRLSELERLGVCKIVGEHPCKVTGRMAMLWDVTSAMPSQLVKHLPKVQRYRNALRSEIARHEHAGRNNTARRLRQLIRDIEAGR